MPRRKRQVGRTEEERKQIRKEYNHEYRMKNKEKLAPIDAEYRRNHRPYNRIYARTYYNKHKEEISKWAKEYGLKNRHRIYAYRIKKSYGITIDEYNEMLKNQDGKCAICKCVPEKKLHVDHDHKNNTVRGLLCSRCNRGVGIFFDDPNLFKKCAEYIEKSLNNLK